MTFKEYFIRPANNNDEYYIKEIVFSILTEYGLIPDEFGKDNDLNDIEKYYFLQNGFFGVVVETKTNEIVGTIGLAFKDVDTCELRKMYLMKSYRGLGLGKFMLNTAIELSRQKKYKKITLETISPLKEAIALYKLFGFNEIAPHKITKRVDQAFELYVH